MRMLLSMLSHAFLRVDKACYAFKKIMQQIDHCKEEMLSARDVIEEEDCVPFNEWLSVSAANYAAEDDEQLLAKFRRNMHLRTPQEVGQLGNANSDVLATAALIELLVSVKYVIFMPATGLCALLLSDT